MKHLVIALLLLLSVVANATITAEEEFALNRLSGTARKYSLGTLIHKNVNVVVGKYSYAVQGGVVGDVTLRSDLSSSASSISIPDNAIIKQVWVDNLVTVSGGSIALKLQSAADLKAETSAATYAAGTVIAGTPIGTAATMIKLTAARTLKATLSSTVTAGQFNVYVEYVLGD